MGGDSILTTKSPADPDYDTELAIGAAGMGTLLHRDLVIVPVVNAYQAANPNRPLTSPAELLPYATTNSQRRAIEAAMAKK